MRDLLQHPDSPRGVLHTHDLSVLSWSFPPRVSRSLSLTQHPFSLTCIQRGSGKEPQPRFITGSRRKTNQFKLLFRNIDIILRTTYFDES